MVLTAVNAKFGIITVNCWLTERGDRINEDQMNYRDALVRLFAKIKERNGEEGFKKQWFMQDGLCYLN